MTRQGVIPLCEDCKHCIGPAPHDPAQRNRCAVGAGFSGAPLTCADARTSNPWCWCGPTGRLFEPRGTSWWRKLTNWVKGWA